MEEKLHKSVQNFQPFEKLIEKNGVIILDGALGTQLEAKGADLKNGLWSASLLKTHPELIQEVQLDYLEAGADIIATAGYQASLPAFIKNGYTEEQGIELIRKTVELAQEAREQFINQNPHLESRPLIAASMGPYGAYLANGSEYHGNYGVNYSDLVQFHKNGIRLIQDLNADILAFETIPSMEESMAIVEALRDFPKLKCWISFSCRNETEVSHGEKLGDCIQKIQDSDQVVAMGINCTKPEFVESLIYQVKQNTQKWIIVYPNKGEVYDAEKKIWTENHNTLDFIELSQKWYNAGARIIGGCCGTNPENIVELSKYFKTKK